MLQIKISDNQTKIINKFNYSTLTTRPYIYSGKINNKNIDMHEFIN